MGATFSIYLSDSTPDEVFEWIDAQTNLSASLRDLIIASTEDSGITDLSAGATRRSRAKEALESRRLKQERADVATEETTTAPEEVAEVARGPEPAHTDPHITGSDDHKPAASSQEKSGSGFGDLNSLMGF